MQTDDNSCTVKRLVRRPFCLFIQVPDLAWNGLIIRWLQVQVLQEAFVRSVLRAAQRVSAASPDSRVETDLIRQLGAFARLPGQPLPAVTLLDSLPEITVVLDPEASGADRYVLDVPALFRRQPFQGSNHADLVVQFRDRLGQEVRGRLEDAPEEIVILDPDNPPTWLSL